MTEFQVCAECRMHLLTPTEYHPYEACVRYKRTQDGDDVRRHVRPVIMAANGQQGAKEKGGITNENGV